MTNAEDSRKYRKLVAAVVLQAVKDLSDKGERDRALDWFNSANAQPFSFVWCAEALDLDPCRLRSAALRPRAISHARDRLLL